MANICFDSEVLLKILTLIVISIFVYNIFCVKKPIVEGQIFNINVSNSPHGKSQSSSSSSSSSSSGSSPPPAVDYFKIDRKRWPDSDKDQYAKLRHVKGTPCENVVKFGFQLKTVKPETPIYMWHGCTGKADGWKCVRPDGGGWHDPQPALGSWSHPSGKYESGKSICPTGYCYRPVGWVWHGKEHSQLCYKPDPNWISPEQKAAAAN